jgi:purine-binding chemotaxis protein CheW
MSHKAEKKTELMDQQLALHSYLEEMLSEVPEYIEESTLARPRPVAVAPAPEQVVVPEPVVAPVEVEVEAKVEPEVQVEAETRPVVTTEEKVQEESQVEQVHATAVAEPVVPEWAEHEFQCLLFNIAGIMLAVPLVKLNGVIPWSDKITPMPGHSDAFLGLLRHLGNNVKVMDAAQIILPEKQRVTLEKNPENRIEKIILMDEGRWGIACDEVGEVVTLNKSDVRWRTPQGKRPWLAGTVSERLCAVLDTDVFAEMLAKGINEMD